MQLLVPREQSQRQPIKRTRPKKRKNVGRERNERKGERESDREIETNRERKRARERERKREREPRAIKHGERKRTKVDRQMLPLDSSRLRFLFRK